MLGVMGVSPHRLAMLRLCLTPGLGPVLSARAIEAFGSAEALLEDGGASEHGLRRVQGIGEEKARVICAGLRASGDLAQRELEHAERLGVHIVARGDEAYPPLLREIPAAPIVLFVRGRLDAHQADRYGVGVIGSRECSTYGLEQAARFASGFAQSGLTVISGGARGIDTAAHKAALQAPGGRTIVVQGCGLAHTYPPENARLFAQVVERDAGCVVSELPLSTSPASENFPARNRIISGLSLGVLVVEAAKRSGALITARLAIEDHNREVFAVPGRVDSAYSAGSLELLKGGGAALVTHPDDVLGALESRARHHHQGTHATLFSGVMGETEGASEPSEGAATTRSRTEESIGGRSTGHDAAAGASGAIDDLDRSLSDRQRAILAALDEARSMDDVLARVGGDTPSLRADLTMLEIKRRVRRSGSKFERTR